MPPTWPNRQWPGQPQERVGTLHEQQEGRPERKGVQRGRPWIDTPPGRTLAQQTVSGKYHAIRQADDNAGRVGLPGRPVVRT